MSGQAVVPGPDDHAESARVELRVLLIADTRPELGMPLGEFVKQCSIDAVVTVGDLHPGLLIGIDELPIPTLGVYGNHCNGSYLEDLGVKNLHLSSESVAGVTFTGLEGCVRYKDGYDILYTQQEYADMVVQLPPANIVVTHCPPRGLNDHPDPAHVGIDALRQWVDRRQPSVLIHGHTYPEDPVTRCGRTRIVYVRGAKILRSHRKGTEAE
ncbi:metallophosphoesterase family protein [Mycolicibacterium llatzerense]|uniref:metallophosphoesterase family protein n=1 Tax=Mycolicibacterium llatzerense TaxID=280871 RepID=UPI0009F51B1F|nr:metallophosphoesterase [Mycolicibacterium llatzerense]